MKFPWNKYEELLSCRLNTLQVFITNHCNLNCGACFARHLLGEKRNHISLEEYEKAIQTALTKGVERINLLGGEPLLHPNLKEITSLNKENNLKTTIYTNGYFLNDFKPIDFDGIKIRISIGSIQENYHLCDGR